MIQACVVISYQYLTNFVAWLSSTASKLGALFIESFSKIFRVTWCFVCLLKPQNNKGSFDKHVLLKRLHEHDNKIHIKTCCDFFIKYLYLRGNSK